MCLTLRGTFLFFWIGEALALGVYGDRDETTRIPPVAVSWNCSPLSYVAHTVVCTPRATDYADAAGTGAAPRHPARSCLLSCSTTALYCG